MCCVGSGLCDELITCSEESDRVCLFVCDLERSKMSRPKLDLSVAAERSPL
jgi:hypothetical protein